MLKENKEFEVPKAKGKKKKAFVGVRECQIQLH